MSRSERREVICDWWEVIGVSCLDGGMRGVMEYWSNGVLEYWKGHR
jgi:hypothetical protein